MKQNLLEKLSHSAIQGSPCHLQNPKVHSLSCSQEPTTGPFHEPDEFSPHLAILIPYNPF